MVKRLADTRRVGGLGSKLSSAANLAGFARPKSGLIDQRVGPVPNKEYRMAEWIPLDGAGGHLSADTRDGSFMATMRVDFVESARFEMKQGFSGGTKGNQSSYLILQAPI